MGVWNCRGEIYMESTGESASYDVDIDYMDIENVPDAMKILYYLMNTGDLQIIPESTEYIPDEYDEDDGEDEDE